MANKKALPRTPEASEGQSRIVGMPSFVDPNLPEASGASVNFGHDRFAPIEDHPLAHAKDYGKVAGGLEAASEQEGGTKGDSESGDERDDWKKDDWKTLAGEYELPTSGTVAELRERVEAHEAELEKANNDEDTKDGDR